MLESKYQAGLIIRLRKRFPGCLILKNDSAYLQGIPDLSIFLGKRWGMLEVKPSRPEPGTDDFEPNQEWYIETINQMSFCDCIYPENEEEVLDELQQALQPRRAPRNSKS